MYRRVDSEKQAIEDRHEPYDVVHGMEPINRPSSDGCKDGVVRGEHAEETPEARDNQSLVVVDLPVMDKPNMFRQPGKLARFCGMLRRNLLMVLTVVAIILGFAFGFALRTVALSEDAVMWLRLPGQLFLNLLRMTIVPVVVTSVLMATANLNPRENGKISAIEMSWLVATNVLGAAVGISLAYAIRPGGSITDQHQEDVRKVSSQALSTQDIFLDLIRNFIPDNIVRATTQKRQTSYEESTADTMNLTLGLRNGSVTEYTRAIIWSNDVNVLGIIFVSVLFGAATSKAGPKGKPFLAFFSSALDVVLIVLQWCIWFSPIGVLSLTMVSIAVIDDLETTFLQLGLFVATVMTGLVFHQVALIPLIYFVGTRGANPFRIYRVMPKPWMAAFATGSSACALPYIYEACDDLEVDRRISGIAIPLAVSLNADGSGLFICVASMFLAQLTGVSVSAGTAVSITVLTAISTMALPSIPSASLVTIVIICTSLGIPTSNIGLLFAVEWLLDRVRTTSNVVSEVVSVAFVNHLCAKDLVCSEREHRNEHKPDDNLNEVNTCV